MDALNPYAALLYRRAQLAEQEKQAMGQPAGQPMPAPATPAMGQAQFSGYDQRPQMSPQQAAQLRLLLQNRLLGQ